MIKKNETESQQRIEVAAEMLAQIFIQQITYKKLGSVDKKIENQYGKSKR